MGSNHSNQETKIHHNTKEFFLISLIIIRLCKFCGPFEALVTLAMLTTNIEVKPKCCSFV